MQSVSSAAFPRPSAARAVAAPPSMIDEILSGLRHPQKYINAKYLYDAYGSTLFERITTLTEYYPTRTELGILDDNAEAIAVCAGRGCTLVEIGSGDSRKADKLLHALDAPRAYVPVDIDPDALARTVRRTRARWPDLPVRGVQGDFVRLELPDDLPRGRRLGFFAGSTIGNFEPFEACELLRSLRSVLRDDGALLIGVDLRKCSSLLLPAYDDAAGITAAFNLNLLTRCNRELDATFDLDRFRHVVRYDSLRGRIEMHLESVGDQIVEVAGEDIRFAAGETIHTESSHKYTIDQFRLLARTGGWEPTAVWTDAQRLFSLHFLEAV